jgi:hypothetical protein
MGASTMLARLAAGDIVAATVVEIRTLLGLSTADTPTFTGVDITGGFLNIGTASSNLTIASGVITATRTFHSVDTEASAATDDCDTINGFATGRLLVLRSNASARDVTFRTGVGGNLNLEGNCTLKNSNDRLILLGTSTGWNELARGFGGSYSVYPQRVLFTQYIEGTTSGPTTTATTSGTAPVLAEMTHTFTPEDDNNDIEVEFGGSFQGSADIGARVGVFIDGVLQTATETREYVGNAVQWHSNLYTSWRGKLSAASHTITIRFWTSSGTLTALTTLRRLTVKEVKS